jgi:hypothetical protein
MTDDEKIPGTRVPDTPIHRASMWLEYLKFRERRKDASAPEDMDDATWETFVAATGANFTVEQMQEAAAYYGQNMLQMMLGGRVDFAIPSPTGKGHISGRSARSPTAWSTAARTAPTTPPTSRTRCCTVTWRSTRSR